MDLLIKDLDEYALMDIMDVIHQYDLKFSTNRREETNCDNDFKFQDLMKRIINKNTVLSESMQPLVEEYKEQIESYLGDDDENEYELLIEKCNEITYIK